MCILSLVPKVRFDYRHLNLYISARRCDVENDISFLVEFIKAHHNIRFPPADAVCLYTTNSLAKSGNQEALEAVPGNSNTYVAQDFPRGNRNATNALNFEANLLHLLPLKVGAKVLLTKNIDVPRGWINGTVATIKEMHQDRLVTENPIGTKVITRVVAHVPGTVHSRNQYPIMLAYALTIHKVQSLTLLNKVVIEFEDVISHGQLYAAMSCVKREDDVSFFGFDPDSLKETMKLQMNLDAIELLEYFININK